MVLRARPPRNATSVRMWLAATGAVLAVAIALGLAVADSASAALVRELVRADCSSQASTQTVTRYDDGSVEHREDDTGPRDPDSSSQIREGTWFAKRVLSFSKTRDNVNRDLELRLDVDRGADPEASPMAAYDFEGGEGIGRYSNTKTTVAGAASLVVKLQLGRRRMYRLRGFELTPPPNIGEDAGGLDYFDEHTVSLRRYEKLLRRFEAKGGRVRVRFAYRFPATTFETFDETSKGINPDPETGEFQDVVGGTTTYTTSWPAVTCGARSRLLRLTRR